VAVVRPDVIGRWFDQKIDIRSRTLRIFSEIDEHSVDEAIAGLNALEQINDNEITIMLNSPGGDWYGGMAVYDYIRQCKSFVHIIAYGYCMSMASVILQAGDRRTLSPNATMMIHYGTSYADGHSVTVVQTAREVERGNKVMEDIYLEKIREKNPKFARRRLREMLMPDYYLTAPKAVELNLADAILGE
jgi:ATP-dependent Clp protease protease subunit